MYQGKSVKLRTVAEVVGFTIAAFLVSGVLAFLVGGMVFQRPYPKLQTPGMKLAPMIAASPNQILGYIALIDTLCWFTLISVAYWSWRKFRRRSQSRL
jgi:cytochrome bd-type quinol oxidase subunit 2